MKEEIINWLNRIEQIDGVPPKEVIAFNFGLFESEDGYKMYLVGGFEYDEDDDDWACIEMPEKPHRYMDIPSDLQSKTWKSVLKHSAKVLSELEQEGKLNNTLVRNAIAITTGFDDGDLMKIR